MKNIDSRIIDHLVTAAEEASAAKADNSDSNSLSSQKCDLELLVSVLDYTSLSVSDSPDSIRAFTRGALNFADAAAVVSVAASTADFSSARGGFLPASICVYPSMVESVGLELGESPVEITAVCGGFPSGLTYLEVKLLECAMAIENGAGEIDVVANIGALLSGDFDIARGEIEAIKAEVGDDALLKVILETAVLKDYNLIYRAAMIALDAGADFVKTSTGKVEQGGATRGVVAVMCLAVKDFYEATGLRRGVKVSGGVSTVDDGLSYLGIVRAILGEEWCVPSLFRIGSSSLLGDISGRLKIGIAFSASDVSGASASVGVGDFIDCEPSI